MRTGRLTLGLLAVSVVLLAAVPPIRQASLALTQLSSAEKPRVKPRDLEKTALAHPQDGQAWFGFAGIVAGDEYLTSPDPVIPPAIQKAVDEEVGPLAATSAIQAYAKALALASDPLPVKFHLAVCHLSEAGDLDRPDQYLKPPEHWTERPRTAVEAAHLRAARDLLLQCRAAAPDNAACEALLAWTWLATHEDSQALAALRAAVAKRSWTLYERETAQAKARLLKLAGGSPADAESIETFGGTPPAAAGSVLGVGQVLSAAGDRHRLAGRHAQAAETYMTCFRIGSVAWRNAYETAEALNVYSLCEMPGRSLLTEQELKTTGTYESMRAELQRIRELGATRLVAYLRAHGRGADADFVQSEVAAAGSWRRELEASPNRRGRMMIAESHGGLLNAAGLWVLGALILLDGLAAMLVVAVFWRRRPRPDLMWRPWEWLLLLGIAAVPGQAVLFLVSVQLLSMGDLDWEVIAARGLAPIILGAALWLVALAVLCARKRAALPKEERPTRTSAFFLGVRILAWPTIAALVLMSVVLLWPVRVSQLRMEAEFATDIERGSAATIAPASAPEQPPAQ